MGCSFQEQTAPAYVPHEVTIPASKSAPAWAPLFTGPQVLPGAGPSMGFPQGHSLLRAHPPALAWGLPLAAGGDLLHCRPPWAVEGQPASPWSSPWAAGESLLRCLEHLLPLLLHQPWCLQSCFSHIFLLLPLAALPQTFFSPLLKYILTEVLPP